MRKRPRWADWLAAALAIAAVSEAQARGGSLNYTTIGPTGAMVSNAGGITISGEILGYYTDSQDVEHGFLYNPSNTSYTNIDYPGASGTIALGINPGGTSTSYMVVGVYINNGTPSGFLDTNGSFSTVTGQNGWTDVRPTGVNDSGAIVGSYSNGTNSSGFLYSNGSYTTINDTTAGVINTYAQGINNSGVIVGYYTTSGGEFGFVDNNGVFTTLDPLGATFTRAVGINSAGDIVGFYSDGTNDHGYLYNPSNMTYTILNYPGEPDTGAQGINDSGQIVGFYENSNGNEFGFLATPAAPTVPEPSSAVMAVVGGLAVLGLAWRNRRGARAVTARYGG